MRSSQSQRPRPVTIADAASSAADAAGSIFISYSHADKPFAQQLAEGLRSAGYRVWIDEGEIVVGDSLVQVIARAVEAKDYLVALISEASVHSSWCRKELALAITQGLKQIRVKVLPVRVGIVEMPPELADVLYTQADPANPASVIADLDRAIAKHERDRADAKSR